MWFHLIATLVTISALVIGTPAASPTSSANPYATDFEEARARATDELSLAILADDVITPEEYATSVQAFLACMTEAGYDVVAEPDDFLPAVNTYTWTYPDATPGVEIPAEVWEEYDQHSYNCSQGEHFLIEALYSSTVYFPNKEDVFDANLACLQADGLVPDDFAREDIEHAAMTGDWGDNVNPWTEEFQLCLVNPFKIGLEPDATPIASPASSGN